MNFKFIRKNISFLNKRVKIVDKFDKKVEKFQPNKGIVFTSVLLTTGVGFYSLKKYFNTGQRKLKA